MKNAIKRAGEMAKRVFAGQPALYAFKEQRLATSPGAGNYAFIPLFALPLESFNGAGIAVYKAYGTQPPNLYYGQEQRLDGFEGIEASGIQSTPLIEMDAYLASLQERVETQTEGAA